jgi:hypothetical protein
MLDASEGWSVEDLEAMLATLAAPVTLTLTLTVTLTLTLTLTLKP